MGELWRGSGAEPPATGGDWGSGGEALSRWVLEVKPSAWSGDKEVWGRSPQRWAIIAISQ